MLSAPSLTVSQAGRVLELSARQVVRLADEGRLACVTTPLGRLFEKNDVDQLAAEREARREFCEAA